MSTQEKTKWSNFPLHTEYNVCNGNIQYSSPNL